MLVVSVTSLSGSILNTFLGSWLILTSNIIYSTALVLTLPYLEMLFLSRLLRRWPLSQSCNGFSQRVRNTQGRISWNPTNEQIGKHQICRSIQNRRWNNCRTLGCSRSTEFVKANWHIAFWKRILGMVLKSRSDCSSCTIDYFCFLFLVLPVKGQKRRPCIFR
jgi:hypothetical protein